MLQLSDSPTKFFFLRTWFLIYDAFSSAVFQASLSEFLILLSPGIDLLITDLIPDRGLSVVFPAFDTSPGNLDSFFLRCFACFHAAASTHLMFEVLAAIIYLYPPL